MANPYSEITPEIRRLAEKSRQNNRITPEMYTAHQVKRGLRDQDGNGVVTGLTEISQIVSKRSDGQGGSAPCPGELYYRGIDVRELCGGFLRDGRFGFEETVYLLLFSELPSRGELDRFTRLLAGYRSLPTSFVRDMILKAPGKDIMNMLSRCVLALYTYDDEPDDISVENVLRQSLQLIAEFPLLAVYGCHGLRHYHQGRTLTIRNPDPALSTAENVLRLLRGNGQFTPLEARVLDLALVLHAEHGGGNNSSFTTHVVTSSGTDTYSAVSAALGSLKGPRHGGANVKVVQMFDDMRASVDVRDRDAVRGYLVRLLDREAFDRTGLIYGMGHAVYTLSDPRAILLKRFARTVAEMKGRLDELQLIEDVERLSPRVFFSETESDKVICANVDMYSGFVYDMLGIPEELFTPLFATARMVGWCAHRIEEITNPMGRIMRPAYRSVQKKRAYTPLAERE